jgi:hypothetical protein
MRKSPLSRRHSTVALLTKSFSHTFTGLQRGLKMPSYVIVGASRGLGVMFYLLSCCEF